MESKGERLHVITKFPMKVLFTWRFLHDSLSWKEEGRNRTGFELTHMDPLHLTIINNNRT